MSDIKLSCECKDPECFLALLEEDRVSWGNLNQQRLYLEKRDPSTTYLIIHKDHALDSDFFVMKHGNLILIVEEMKNGNWND